MLGLMKKLLMKVGKALMIVFSYGTAFIWVSVVTAVRMLVHIVDMVKWAIFWIYFVFMAFVEFLAWFDTTGSSPREFDTELFFKNAKYAFIILIFCVMTTIIKDYVFNWLQYSGFIFVTNKFWDLIDLIFDKTIDFIVWVCEKVSALKHSKSICLKERIKFE